jgi:hypothetical protein
VVMPGSVGNNKLHLEGRSHFYPDDDGGSMFIQHAGNYLQEDYMKSQSRQQQY